MWPRIRAWIEPAAAVLAATAVAWWRPEISANFESGGWSLSSFYGAVFDWASVQSALLFGVYAFFLSRSEPFIQAIAGSVAFQQLRRYVIRTLYLTLGLTVAALPVLIAPPAIKGDIGYLVFAAFMVGLTYTFFCFLKVVRVFGKIERR
jgi:hypothetical protein